MTFSVLDSLGLPMFAKVFHQIFESSIAEDYEVRHVFMDLLVLADIDGVVDKTHEAIARMTNMPVDKVRQAIEKLELPDSKSRSDAEDGKRLTRLDEHRDWGWQIVNYQVYRDIRDEEARRRYFRDKKREYRAKSKTVNGRPSLSPPRPNLSNGVLDSPKCPPIQKKIEIKTQIKKPFITREKVEEWCVRKKFSRMVDFAWGKLMSGRFYGTPITDDNGFNAAMENILAEYQKI